jgi:hypothetical protein
MFRLIGYILLGISALSFLLILVFPWLGFSKGETAGIITGLLIVGEVTFYLSIFILGRSFYEKLKSILRFRKPKPSSKSTSLDSR